MPPKQFSLKWGALIALAACDTAGTTAPDDGASEPYVVTQPFPSTQRLEEIVSSEPPQLAPEVKKAPSIVAKWSMAEDLPADVDVAPYGGEDPTLSMIAEAGKESPKVRVTAGMLCYAREFGRFHMEHAEDPPGDIATFMATRCGLTFVPQVAVVDRQPFKGKLKPEALSESVAKTFQSIPDDALAGAWLGTKDGELYFSMSFGFPEAKIEPMKMSAASGGTVDVRGEVDFDFDWIQAYVTKGDLGYRTCVPIPGEVAVGRSFALRCDVDKGDDSAMIQVYAGPPQQVLGSSVALFMVSPSGTLPTSYEAAIERFPIDANDARPEARLTAINTLRERLGHGPLKLATDQCKSVEQLAPHILSKGPHKGHASLGLLAGWAVEGPISDASLTTSYGNQEWSLERELSAQLLSPGFRALVLSETSDVYATGVLEDAARSLRARVELAYDLFEARDYGPEETAIFDYLDAERMAAGQPPIVRVSGPEDAKVLAASAERIRAGQGTPPGEANALAKHYAELTQRSFRTLIFTPMRIDGWRPSFPKEFFSTPHLAAAIKVSYFDPPGVPWGQHVIIVVYTVLDGPMR